MILSWVLISVAVLGLLGWIVWDILEGGDLLWAIGMTALVFAVVCVLTLAGFSIYYGVPMWDVPWVES